MHAQRETLTPKILHTGTKLKVGGRLEEGLALYRQAVGVCPAYAPAHYNIGVIHSERAEFAAAKAFYERAIEAHPGCARRGGPPLHFTTDK